MGRSKSCLSTQTKCSSSKTEWAERYPELGANLGAEIHDYTPPAHWNRKQLRSLGRVSQFAVEAAELALANANLLDENGIILPYLKKE